MGCVLFHLMFILAPAAGKNLFGDAAIGEYFRDTTDGTPWFESILGKGSTLSNKEAILRNRIVRTPGVIRLTSFSTDYDLTTRRYSVSAGILTQYGIAELTVNG